MSRLDLGDSRFPVTIFGKDIDLEKPSMAEIFDYEELVIKAGEDHKKISELMKSFVIKMGMPEELSIKMNLDQFTALMEGLRGLKKN